MRLYERSQASGGGVFLKYKFAKVLFLCLAEAFSLEDNSIKSSSFQTVPQENDVDQQLTKLKDEFSREFSLSSVLKDEMLQIQLQ